jgi:hypothetical protein
VGGPIKQNYPLFLLTFKTHGFLNSLLDILHFPATVGLNTLVGLSCVSL